MINKCSQRTRLGCLEKGVTKDEAIEECWFQLPASNTGVLAEAASVCDQIACIRPQRQRRRKRMALRSGICRRLYIWHLPNDAEFKYIRRKVKVKFGAIRQCLFRQYSE
jgi:hypothetical protein